MKKLHAKDYFTPQRDYFFLLCHLFDTDQNRHCHDYYEIELVVNGSAADEINGESFSLGAGDFVCLQPSDIHNLHVVDARGFELINLAFSQEMMHSVLAFLEVDKETFFEEQITGHLSYENLLLLSETAKKLSGLPDRMREERLIVKEWIVVCLFCYQVSRKEESDMCPLWMKQLLRLLKTPEGFIGGVEFLKAHTEVSYPHVCRCFRKYLHKTPVEWINEQRILYSSYLLLDSRRSVLDISLECGFRNLSHFNHLFKAFYGISPTEYRTQRINATAIVLNSSAYQFEI